jgi:deazaflavin-dependent oxidoreductase (nitroreductase family)
VPEGPRPAHAPVPGRDFCHDRSPVSQALTHARANPVQRALRRLFASGPGSWLFARLGPRIDRPLHRLSGGRVTAASLLSGLPVVMLTTIGARSGRARTVPVLGLPTPDGLAVVASNWGRERHPAWYYNLRANPVGEVEVTGARQRFRAVEAQGDRRERIWREGLAVYPGFSQYERRAPGRRIAVFVLEPE